MPHTGERVCHTSLRMCLPSREETLRSETTLKSGGEATSSRLLRIIVDSRRSVDNRIRKG